MNYFYFYVFYFYVFYFYFYFYHHHHHNYYFIKHLKNTNFVYLWTPLLPVECTFMQWTRFNRSCLINELITSHPVKKSLNIGKTHLYIGQFDYQSNNNSYNCLSFLSKGDHSEESRSGVVQVLSYRSKSSPAHSWQVSKGPVWQRPGRHDIFLTYLPTADQGQSSTYSMIYEALYYETEPKWTSFTL